MRLHLAACLALLALALAPAALAGSAGAAVFNGYPALKGRYPWMASTVVQDWTMDDDNNVIMKKTRRHNCGASLIHPRVLLTAAHCLYINGINEWYADLDPKLQDNTFPQVRLGAYNTSIKGDMGVETRRVVAATVHRLYNHTVTGNDHQNDVALMLLDRPSRLPTVALPKSMRVGAAVQPGTELFLIGWGTSAFTPTIGQDDDGTPLIEQKTVDPHVLQEVDMALNTPALCARRYPAYPFWKGNAFSTDICAGAPYRKTSSCYGDSGGPLFVKAKRGSKQQDMQVGIVSFAHDCGTLSPTVFTNVAHYVDWIHGGIKVLLENGARPAACRKSVVMGNHRVKCK